MWPLQQQRGAHVEVNCDITVGDTANIAWQHGPHTGREILTNTQYSLHCSCWDWLQNLMGMSVHNNGRVNRAMCGVRCCDPPPSSSCAVYLVSTGWRRWRSASRWPEWQEGRSLFPSSSSAEGYCRPAPAERERQRGGENSWSEAVKRPLWEQIRPNKG